VPHGGGAPADQHGHVQRVGRAGGTGVRLPQKIEAELDNASLPYLVRLTVAVVHGQPVCTGLSAERRDGGPPVTRRGLNSLPVDRIVREVVAQSVLKTESSPGTIRYQPAEASNAGPVLARLAPRRGRRSDPEARQELIGKVVAAYRELVASGIGQPKPAIARELSISQSYVAALLTAARRQGLLGPAIPGRAGELLVTPGAPGERINTESRARRPGE
jgi:hypothetical protein